MSPDDRREVLEQLLERVRRNAAARSFAPAAAETSGDLQPAVHTGDNGVDGALHGDETALPAASPPEHAEQDDASEPYLASPAPPPAGPSRPLVRFEFEDEQTATGDPYQIEALVLAEAAAAEAAARGLDDPLPGPSTIPPAMPPGPTAPGYGSGPLELDDLDSLGAPPLTSGEAMPPAWVPPLPPPPAIDEPPAYVAEPPAYVAEPPAYVAEPPAYVAEPPPSVTEIADDDESVIELDEADLASVPPEPMAPPEPLADPMTAAYEAGLGGAQAYDDQGPETDHAGFVDRQSIEDIEAAVLPTEEPASPAEVAHADPAPAPPRIEEPAPESQRKVRELDRPIDDALDGVDAEEEPPPESGEVESQRYPAQAAPIVDEVSADRRVDEPVHDEAALDEAPTPPPRSRLAADAGPSVTVIERPPPPDVAVAAYAGARPRADDSFGTLLDRALSLGE